MFTTVIITIILLLKAQVPSFTRYSKAPRSAERALPPPHRVVNDSEVLERLVCVVDLRFPATRRRHLFAKKKPTSEAAAAAMMY